MADGESSSRERRDVSLIRRIQQHDAAALDELLRAYWTPLLQYARHMAGSVDSAQDVLQDVFVRLWRTRASLDIRAGVAPYLYRMVRNQTLTALSADRAARVRDGLWLMESATMRASALNEGVGATEASDVHRKLWHALDGVPPRCREIFLLNWEHGLSYLQIAELLEIGVPTVRNQMSRAVKHLEGRIAMGDFPPEWSAS